MTVAELKRPEASHIWQREEHEHYVEPEWVSRRLFEVEKFEGAIWEPCCGFGRIAESAKAAGHLVTASDIVDRGYPGMDATADFLQGVGTECPNIVGNPPFDVFQQFADHALSIATNKVALVWLVRTLPAARWLRDTPLAKVLLLTPRPSMPPGHVITAGYKTERQRW